MTPSIGGFPCLRAQPGRRQARAARHFVPTKQPAPLFLDEAQTIALALYNPADPSYLLLLGEHLGELHDPPFSAEQLRGRYSTEA